MPLGFLLALLVLVVPHLGGGQVEGRDGCAPRRVAQFGIAAEIAHENDFVHAAHGRLSFEPRSRETP
ncbi:hypothetical protein D3C83_34500 [compost metagenome]